MISKHDQLLQLFQQLIKEKEIENNILPCESKLFENQQQQQQQHQSQPSDNVLPTFNSSFFSSQSTGGQENQSDKKSELVSLLFLLQDEDRLEKKKINSCPFWKSFEIENDNTTQQCHFFSPFVLLAKLICRFCLLIKKIICFLIIFCVFKFIKCNKLSYLPFLFSFCFGLLVKHFYRSFKCDSFSFFSGYFLAIFGNILMFVLLTIYDSGESLDNKENENEINRSIESFLNDHDNYQSEDEPCLFVIEITSSDDEKDVTQNEEENEKLDEINQKDNDVESFIANEKKEEETDL